MSTVAHDEGGSPAGQSAELPGDRGVVLLLLGAPDRDGLLALVDGLLAQPVAQPLALPAMMAQHAAMGARLALAVPPYELRARLQMARDRLFAATRPRLSIKNSGIYINIEGTLSPQSGRRIAFLFPGQGSQHPGMLRDFCAVSPLVGAWFDALDGAYERAGRARPSRLIDGEAQDALFGWEQGAPLSTVANLALFDLISQLGIRADALVGHSIGEHAAVLAAGRVAAEQRQTLCEELCRLGLAGIPVEKSAVAEGMATVSAFPRARLAEIVARHPQQLFIAMDNCPNQQVLAGLRVALEDAIDTIVGEGGICATLPFVRAYHTPLLGDCAGIAERWYRKLALTPTPRAGKATPVYSCLTSRPIPGDPVAAAQVMAGQWTAMVNFRATIDQLYSERIDTFIEVGPDAKLTAFVEDTLRGRAHLAVSVAAPSLRGPSQNSTLPRDLEQLGHMLAALYMHGVPVDPVHYTALLRGTAGAIPVVSPPSRPSLRGEPAPLVQALAVHRSLIDEAAAALAVAAARVRPLLPGAVSGRTTIAPTHPPPAGWPLLGEGVHVTGARLTVDRSFTLARDPFLADHSIGHRRDGQRGAKSSAGAPLPVISFTTSLELAAEAAQRLLAYRAAGTSTPPALVITDSRAHHWLALDGGALHVKLEAAQQGSTVHVSLQEGSGEQRAEPPEDARTASGIASPPAFQATVNGATAAQVAALTPKALWQTDRAARKPLHWTAATFYANYAFHGPSFRGLVHVLSVGPDSAEATVRVTELPGIDSRMLQLDPALLDCAGQLVAFWLLEYGARPPTFGIFPVGARRVIRHQQTPAPGTLLCCRCRVTLGFGGITSAAVGFFTADNQVVASIEGFTQRLIEFPPALAGVLFGKQSVAFSAALACAPGQVKRQIDSQAWSILEEGQSIWGRVLAQRVLNPRERAVWQSLPALTAPRAPGSPQRQTQWLLRQLVAKEAVSAWLMEHQQPALELAEIHFDPALPTNGVGEGEFRVQWDAATIPNLWLLLRANQHFMTTVVERREQKAG